VTKTTALAMALLLGVASAAYAGGSREDADPSTGGYRVGPVGNPGQTGVNPVDHPSLRGAYGYAYQARGKRNQSR
jgi:hypothetical protein